MDEVFTNQTLANASVGDTIHDFGHNIKSLFENLKMDKKTMENYCQGIPICYDKNFNINDEASVLAGMVKQKSYVEDGKTVNIDYSKSKEEYYIAPRNVLKTVGKNLILKSFQEKMKEEHLDNYEITTVNNVKYRVISSTVVEKFDKSLVQKIKNAAGLSDSNDNRKMCSAADFIKKFEIEDNSVLVVDFAAVSIMSILKNGPPQKTRIFYAMTPEVENDPAPKLSIDDEVFYEKSGVELVSMFQKDKAGIVYPYSYSVENEDKYNYSVGSIVPAENFYSNYIFYLSGLIPKNENATKFTTDIKVSHPTKTNLYTSTISNSKIQNSISNTSSEIRTLLGLKKPTESDIFRMNSKYQLKRSGDWLQVLACVNLHSKILQGYSNKKYSEKDMGSVYFVTHDRIALAFALLNGINCIYTHASSFACYVFKAQDVGKEKNINLVKVRNITGEYQKIYLDNEKKVDEIYPKYMEFYERMVEEWKRKLEEKCENARETLYDGSTLKEFDISKFDGLVHELFETAYIYNAIMFVYTNLKGNHESYVESREKMRKSIRVAIDSQDKLEEIGEEAMKEIIQDYRKYVDANVGLLLCLDINYKVDDSSVAPFITNVEKAVDEIKKNKYYKSIRSWTWNTMILARVRNTIESLANMKPMDQNEFLYHLKRLDQKSIVNIVRTFEHLYYVVRDADILINYARETIRGKLENTSLKRVEKFSGVVLPFIVEVFISVGELVKDDSLEEKLRELVQSEISTMEPTSQVLTDAAIVQENTVAMKLSELDIAGALLLLSREIRMNPSLSMSMSNMKPSVRMTTGGAGSTSKMGKQARIFLEHSLRETTYTFMERLLSINVKKSPAFYDFIHTSIISVAGIAGLVSPTQEYSEELGEAYGKLQVLYGWLKTQPVTEDTNAMLKMVELLLETQTAAAAAAAPEKRKRSASEKEIPAKRRRIAGGASSKTPRQNIYRGNHACFHPLFPLYVMCESLYQMSYSLEKESFDTVPFFQYINFVAKLVNGIATEIKTSTVGQLKAAYFGLALREMFFSTNMYLHTDIYTKTMGMNREQYLPLLLTNSVLSVPFISREKSREGVFIRCPLFLDFLRKLNMNEVVERTPDISVEKARSKIIQIMDSVTRQIMDDRGIVVAAAKPKVQSVAAISAKLGVDVKKPSSQKKKTRSTGKLTKRISREKAAVAAAKIHPVAPAGVHTQEIKKPNTMKNFSPPKLNLFGKRKMTKSASRSAPKSGPSNKTRKIRETARAA